MKGICNSNYNLWFYSTWQYNIYNSSNGSDLYFLVNAERRYHKRHSIIAHLGNNIIATNIWNCILLQDTSRTCTSSSARFITVIGLKVYNLLHGFYYCNKALKGKEQKQDQVGRTTLRDSEGVSHAPATSLSPVFSQSLRHHLVTPHTYPGDAPSPQHAKTTSDATYARLYQTRRPPAQFSQNLPVHTGWSPCVWSSVACWEM